MLVEDIQKRKLMLLSKYSGILDDVKNILSLKGETYTSYTGKEILFGEGIEDFYEKYISVASKKERERERERGDNSAIPEPNRVLLTVTFEKIHAYNGDDLIGDLKDKISCLEEAIDIHNATNENLDKKLDYLLTSEETNKHLLSAGYFYDIAPYLQEEINKFSSANNLRYFKVTAEISKFSDNELVVRVDLDDDMLPSILMYTHIDIKKRK